MTFDKEWENNTNFFHRMLIKFAQKFPYKYEARLSHILPAEFTNVRIKGY